MGFKRKTILLTVVRHGETDSNKTGVLQGQINVPLSSTGQLQADRAGNHLEKCQFDCAFSSDLERAFQTANTIIKNNKHKETTNDVKTNMLIREKSFGKLENTTLSEYSKIAKNDGCQDEYQYAPEGGERNLFCEKKKVRCCHANEFDIIKTKTKPFHTLQV